MAASAITPTQAVVSVVVVPPLVAATSVATVTVTMLAVALTTAPRMATSAKSSRVSNNAPNPVSISAKKVAVLTLPEAVTTAVVTALSSALHLRTLGTRATAALPRAKTHARTVHVKAAAGKIVVVTTATPPVLPLAVQRVQVTSLPAAPSSLVPATSNPMLLAKVLQASVVAPAC